MSQISFVKVGILCFLSVAGIFWWNFNKHFPRIMPEKMCTNSENSCKCHTEAFPYLEKSQAQKLIFDSSIPEQDPMLLHYICKYHLEPISYINKYNLEKPYRDYIVDGNITLALKTAGVAQDSPGFFIECGANNGEYLSNTIGLEIGNQWTGLLIEASPSLYEKLKSKNRRSWISDVCLSGKPERIDFLKSKDQSDWKQAIGKIDWGNKYETPKHTDWTIIKKDDYDSEGKVECISLYSILSAINVKTVDFFSLDVEGHEYKVLELFPFDKIDIKVLIVEHWYAPEGKLAIKSLMESKGYTIFLDVNPDYIFIKKP